MQQQSHLYIIGERCSLQSSSHYSEQINTAKHCNNVRSPHWVVELISEIGGCWSEGRETPRHCGYDIQQKLPNYKMQKQNSAQQATNHYATHHQATNSQTRAFQNGNPLWKLLNSLCDKQIAQLNRYSMNGDINIIMSGSRKWWKTIKTLAGVTRDSNHRTFLLIVDSWTPTTCLQGKLTEYYLHSTEMWTYSCRTLRHFREALHSP